MMENSKRTTGVHNLSICEDGCWDQCWDSCTIVSIPPAPPRTPIRWTGMDHAALWTNKSHVKTFTLVLLSGMPKKQTITPNYACI